MQVFLEEVAKRSPNREGRDEVCAVGEGRSFCCKTAKQGGDEKVNPGKVCQMCS